jgi:alpha-tubulin suppressor-like RCC1 family protein
VAGGLRWRAVGVSRRVSCALTSEGAAYCWGLNSAGVLGHEAGEECDDINESIDTPTPVYRCTRVPTPVATSLRFTSIAVSEDKACAIAAGDGAAHCWGGDWVRDGEQLLPTTRPPWRIKGAERLRALTAGEWHWCALGGADGAVCWGRNLYGQLGTGDDDDRDEDATPALPAVRFASMAAGAEHTCGATTDGRVLCWGRGTEGQLGDGRARSSEAPVEVRLPQ